MGAVDSDFLSDKARARCDEHERPWEAPERDTDEEALEDLRRHAREAHGEA